MMEKFDFLSESMSLNKRLYKYIQENLRQSLDSIGFSDELIEDIINNLHNLKKIKIKYLKQFERVYSIGFFQKIVPEYFEKYVIPEIPDSDKFLDVGCGTGILINRMTKTNRFKYLKGIDILEYKEWKIFSEYGVDFEIVDRNNFAFFLKKYNPDSIALTWTLHHMEKKEQKIYLKNIFSNIKKDTVIVILEDSYSESLQPESGYNRYRQFMIWNKNNRKKIMSIYDWLANRVLAQRSKVNMPFSFRTVREWIKLFKEIGFKINLIKFIGFPDKRDINTPQSLIVIRK